MSSTDLLPATARRLEHHLARAQSTGRLPSVAAGVVRDGALVWSGGRGRVVRGDTDSRPDADTQFKIGSVTKTMTAALVMLAREQGHLTLNDPVARFLPDGPFPRATLRSLLSHSSGMPAEPHGPWWERSPGVEREALVAAHVDATPTLEPGARFHYSNLGYGVLGEIVADVFAGTWADVLAEHVLGPLGMTRTTYQFQAPHAEGFSVDLLTGELTPEPLPDTGVMAAAGQLWSTVADQATWLTALVDPDRSILTAASLEAMRTPQSAAPEDRGGQAYGLGVQLVLGEGRMLLGHGGSMPGFCCGVLVDVDTRVGAVALCNGAYGLGDVPGQMLRTVLDAEPPPAAEWRPTRGVPDDVREVVGTWHWGHAASLLTVEHAHDDTVRVALDPVRGGGRVLGFERTGRDTYVGTRGYFAGETLRVVRDEQGSVSHLECATFVMTRTPYDPAAPIPGGPPPPRQA